jgi:hypothetical protein
VIKLILLNPVISLTLLYASISLTGSIIKTIVGDCDKKYVIDSYVKTDWLCPVKENPIPFHVEMDKKKRK